jgi:hypothetical protein
LRFGLYQNDRCDLSYMTLANGAGVAERTRISSSIGSAVAT